MYEKLDFSLHFSNRKAWDPSKKLDLAICYTGKRHSSVRFNLTDLVKKEGCKLATNIILTAFGARPPVVAKESPPEIWEAPIHPICTINTHTSGLTTTSQISGGDLFVI